MGFHGPERYQNAHSRGRPPYVYHNQKTRNIKKRKIKVIFDIDDDIEKLGYAPTIKIALNTKKVQKLGWKAEIGLKEAYNRMIEYMKDTKGEKY